MSDNEKSPQSIRLDEFRQKTGYTITQFSTQCGIPSPSTMHKIISEGKTPSPKILKKIITRFPELNHDWVVLGYGEMIIKGMQTQETSAKSLEISAESTYQYIIQALRDHDFALNELSKTIAKVSTAAEIVNNQVVQNTGQMAAEAERRTKVFFEKLQGQITTVTSYFHNELDKFKIESSNTETETRAYIDSLDRRRSKINAEALDKLSEKIHSYLKDTRNKQEKLIEKKLDQQWKQYQEKINKDLGIFNEVISNMEKNIMLNNSNNTDKAISSFKNLGQHTKHINPRPSK